MQIKSILILASLVIAPCFVDAQVEEFRDPEDYSKREAKDVCKDANQAKNRLIRSLSDIQESAVKEQLSEYRNFLDDTAENRTLARKAHFESIVRPSLNEDAQNVIDSYQNLSVHREQIAIQQAEFFSSLYPEILTSQQYKRLIKLEYLFRKCMFAPRVRARGQMEQWLEN